MVTRLAYKMRSNQSMWVQCVWWRYVIFNGLRWIKPFLSIYFSPSIIWSRPKMVILPYVHLLVVRFHVPCFTMFKCKFTCANTKNLFENRQVSMQGENDTMGKNVRYRWQKKVGFSLKMALLLFVCAYGSLMFTIVRVLWDKRIKVLLIVIKWPNKKKRIASFTASSRMTMIRGRSCEWSSIAGDGMGCSIYRKWFHRRHQIKCVKNTMGLRSVVPNLYGSSYRSRSL